MSSSNDALIKFGWNLPWGSEEDDFEKLKVSPKHVHVLFHKFQFVLEINQSNWSMYLLCRIFTNMALSFSSMCHLSQKT